MKVHDTYYPYRTIERDPIQYSYCVDYGHLSRYRALRQIIHQGLSEDRFVALETVNPFGTASDMKSYVVPSHLENRLDIIAQQQLGSATYAWIIAYVNRIADGFTVLEGTRLQIPTSITGLFNKDELLAPIDATKLNLGSE